MTLAKQCIALHGGHLVLGSKLWTIKRETANKRTLIDFQVWLLKTIQGGGGK